MKRNICTMLCLLLSVLLVFSLAACQDSSNDPATTPSSSSTAPTEPTQPTEPPYMPASAAELWEKVDGAMNALTSVETTTVRKIVYYATGYEITVDSTAVSVSADDFEYIEANTKTVCPETEWDQTIRNVSAYYDGKMYNVYCGDYYNQKLCSVATREEYNSTRPASLNDEINVAECTGGKFTKNADGTWSLEFSGYTSKTMTKVLDTMGMTSDMLGVPIEDMKITVLADKDFLAKTITIAFQFQSDDDSMHPEYTETTEYSKYNSAVFDPKVLEADEYVEVDDLFVLKMIDDGIKQRQEASSGHFELDVKNTTRYYGQTNTSKETDLITYGKKNGAYYYSIVADVNGSKMTMAYQNGVQTIVADGQTYNNPYNDETAKLTIDSLIDTAMFYSLAVTDIEKEGEGVYMLTCENLDLSAYEGNVAEGVTLEYGEQAIKVTFKDGQLVKIESLLCLEGKYDYNDLELDVKSVVDFEKEADYPTI